MITHQSFIPTAFVWLGLVCAAALVVSTVWFFGAGSASGGVSPRGTAGVTASGVGDPPWTSGVADPPWT